MGMGMGLLGAIGGLGKGLETFGGDLIRRREQALDEARREAEYQRRQADADRVRQEERDYTSKRDAEKERAADERTAAQIAATNAREDARLKQRQTERAEDRKFKVEDREETLKGQERLAKLRAQLQASNDAASARLRDQLEQDDIQRIEYGKPDKEGYAEVIKVLKDGRTIRTGEHVYKPRLDYENDDEESTTL